LHCCFPTPALYCSFLFCVVVEMSSSTRADIHDVPQ
jgi:hypothetical protein